MKKLMISIALLTVSFVALAQKPFTQATFNELLEEYKKDSKAFFMNRLSTDFRYSDTQGTFHNRENILSGDAQKIVSTEVLDPVIFHSCDLAVVSGIHKTVFESGGSQTGGQVACTYTFQRRNGKWLFVASQQTAMPAQ